MNRFPNRFFDLIVAILILRLFSPSAQPLRFERSNLDCGSNATALEPNFFNPPRLRGALVYWPDVRFNLTVFSIRVTSRGATPAASACLPQSRTEALTLSNISSALRFFTPMEAAN
jgi:hypothetical protein